MNGRVSDGGVWSRSGFRKKLEPFLLSLFFNITQQTSCQNRTVKIEQFLFQPN